MRFSIREWAGLLAALFLLNTALSFHNVWPTPWIEVRPELSVEAAIVVLILAAWIRLTGPPARRALIALAVVLFVMTLGRYMEVTAPALYGRAINLYWDARYLPDVVAMFADAVAGWQLAAAGAAIIALAVGLVWVLYRCLQALTVTLISGHRVSRYLSGLAVVLVAAYLFGYYRSAATLRWFSIPVTRTYAEQVGFVADALSGGDILADLGDTEPLAAIDPARLPRRDVIVTFVESYGAVAFDNGELADALAGPRATLADAITRSGRRAASAFIVAPTFGGGSWLSHISFMTGFDINDPARYDALLTRTRDTLPKRFRAAGFRALALMPGLRNQWPEGSFYGFDAILGSASLRYEGPEFGWWRIPDQFALARLVRDELNAVDRAPLFVFFPTISTHAPFRPTPPVQSDWERLLTSDPFDPATLRAAPDEPYALTELRPGYRDALAYTYEYWSSYLETAGGNFLLVLIGDHQPPASIAGEGARWDVPVHVIARDDALIERLIARGFAPGVVPEATPIGAMHELGPLLFE